VEKSGTARTRADFVAPGRFSSATGTAHGPFPGREVSLRYRSHSIQLPRSAATCEISAESQIGKLVLTAKKKVRPAAKPHVLGSRIKVAL
jgi:hypothetical protein